ncbi:MAG: PDZ domain-containing protein [candidate division Zixibacteria bacterium]
MINKLFTIALSCILILSGCLVFANDSESITDIKQVYDKINKSLVVVEYVAEMNFMGQSERMEGRVLGLAVGENLIIFDGSPFGHGAGFGASMFGAPRVDKPTSLKIKDYKGDTYELDYIGVDDYTSIAFGRLKEFDVGKVIPAEFVDTDLKLGTSIYIFWLLPKNYEPRFQVAKSVITNVLSKPEEFYLTGEINQDFIMSPVIMRNGKLAGVVSLAGQASSSPFDYGTVFGPPVGIMPLEKFKNLLAHPPAPDEFKRGWLGVSMQALDPDVASMLGFEVSGGIIVTDILKNTPAEKAGIRTGDFIVEFDGKPIEVTEQAGLSVFQKKISDAGAGGTINLKYIRPGGDKIDTGHVTIVLTQRPISPNDAPRYEDKNYDLTVRDLVFADFNNRDLDEGEIQGIVVEKSESGGWAYVGGVGGGHIIMKINDQEVKSVKDFETIMKEIEANKESETVFMVWRRHKTQFKHVKTHWE